MQHVLISKYQKKVQHTVKPQEQTAHHETEANQNDDSHNRDETDSHNHT